MFNSSRARTHLPPLQIVSQPQNKTLDAGSNQPIGQTSWKLAPGYRRSMTFWQRSVDGQNWFLEDFSNFDDCRFSINLGANPTQNGMRYRVSAYAYERYTSIPNTPGELNQTYETLYPSIWFDNNNDSPTGKVIIVGIGLASYSLMFLKDGQFQVSTSNNACSSNCGDWEVFIGNRSVVNAVTNGSFVGEFNASPGEVFIMRRFRGSLLSTDRFDFQIESKTTVPCTGSKITSEPFTLSVVDQGIL